MFIYPTTVEHTITMSDMNLTTTKLSAVVLPKFLL